MCTAISFLNNNHYFGRTLDLEYSYGESVVIAPREFDFKLRCGQNSSKHYALIGIATLFEGYPLFYEGVNEEGLCVAALNFPHYAVYGQPTKNALNLPSFEIIPYLLSNFKSVSEAKKLFENVNITDETFNEKFPSTPLHWIVSDKKESYVLEQTEKGLAFIENPIGVLTNSPPIDIQLLNLNNYSGLSSKNNSENRAFKMAIKEYSAGLGAIGLPGDFSSMSRFVRASFLKSNSANYSDEASIVSQFFHIMSSVSIVDGSVLSDQGSKKTVYTSCCNVDEGVYYYKTYENSQINAVRLSEELKNGRNVVVFPLKTTQNICFNN